MKRIHSLDGLRGALACVVVAHHIALMCGSNALGSASMVAVGGFFLMSGYVLTLAYDGGFPAFAARRVVRLWPVYGVCMSMGYIMSGHVPSLAVLAWMPGELPRPGMVSMVWDSPAWSLVVEAWAIPLMPFIAWFGAGRRLWLALAVCAIAWGYGLVWFGLFPVGAALSRYPVRLWLAELPPLQWLGKISFSLYLSHCLVLALLCAMLGTVGLWLTFPVSLAVGWAVWCLVERPSIALSRSIGRRYVLLS